MGGLLFWFMNVLLGKASPNLPPTLQNRRASWTGAWTPSAPDGSVDQKPIKLWAYLKPMLPRILLGLAFAVVHSCIPGICRVLPEIGGHQHRFLSLPQFQNGILGGI